MECWNLSKYFYSTGEDNTAQKESTIVPLYKLYSQSMEILFSITKPFSKFLVLSNDPTDIFLGAFDTTADFEIV